MSDRAARPGWVGAAFSAVAVATASFGLAPSALAVPMDAPVAPVDVAPCGPDEATALRTALDQLGPEPVTGRGWEREPLDANYNACADLSTILVMIQGGTGSSPVQALMFHRGDYLGTATSKAYGFTDIDKAASTGETVVLSYRTGQSCTACNDGTVTKVRFHCDGTKVRMLDAPPPG